MPRPSQVRKQQAEKEGGHRSSCGLEPRGYRVVLHDWRRRPLIGEVVLASQSVSTTLLPTEHMVHINTFGLR